MKVPLFRPYWNSKYNSDILEVLDRRYDWTRGPEVELFEKKIKEYLGVKYCITCNSGTSALHMVMLALGIGPGDQVIIPSFTFIATANAPLFVGATPVFADIEEGTFGLDPEDVRRRITDRTKVILPIYYAGCPCLVERLRDLAKYYKVLLVEDAAEAFGASIEGKKVGTFGDAAILSFCHNKVITTGEGGAVVTGNPDLYERCLRIRNHGRLGVVGDFESLGYNFRMSSLTAALGLAQLEDLDYIISSRQGIASAYKIGLGGLEELDLPEVPKGYSHVYQMYCIRVKKGLRDSLASHLQGKGIGTLVYFPPVHLSQHFQRLGSRPLGYKDNLPVTERVSSETLALPVYPDLSQGELDYVIDSVRSFFAK